MKSEAFICYCSWKEICAAKYRALIAHKVSTARMFNKGDKVGLVATGNAIKTTQRAVFNLILPIGSLKKIISESVMFQNKKW